MIGPRGAERKGACGIRARPGRRSRAGAGRGPDAGSRATPLASTVQVE